MSFLFLSCAGLWLLFRGGGWRVCSHSFSEAGMVDSDEDESIVDYPPFRVALFSFSHLVRG